MKILETERLILREMTFDDYNALYAVLADPDITEHYPYTFDEKRVRGWIETNISRYSRYGFGLWAVVLRESGEMIGDCGITMQNIDGELLPEIGYHIRKDCQKKGYGSEAAAECIKYGFSELHFPALYSYMKYTNIPSARVAQKNGMSFVREYEDRENTVTKVYSISREEWENGRKASE